MNETLRIKKIFHVTSASRAMGRVEESSRWLLRYMEQDLKPWQRALERSKRKRNKWGKVGGCKLARYRASKIIPPAMKAEYELIKLFVKRDETRG